MKSKIAEQLIEMLEIDLLEEEPLEQVHEDLRAAGIDPNMPEELRRLIDAARHRVESTKGSCPASLKKAQPNVAIGTPPIPKKLHMIWVGADNGAPESCIQSWRINHPDWDFRLWTEKDLENSCWVTRRTIKALLDIREWVGAAALMRYEILFREGGVYVDADAFCVRPMDSWLLEHNLFACWEEMTARNKRVSTSFIGSTPNNPVIKYAIDRIKKYDRLPFITQAVRLYRYTLSSFGGPKHFTRCIEKFQSIGSADVSILPSHIFAPVDYSGNPYTGDGVVYAVHAFASKKNLYWKSFNNGSLSIENELRDFFSSKVSDIIKDIFLPYRRKTITEAPSEQENTDTSFIDCNLFNSNEGSLRAQSVVAEALISDKGRHRITDSRFAYRLLLLPRSPDKDPARMTLPRYA